MTISSRTPEGCPNRCPVCGHRLRLSPSWPSADAPCPCCGSLVWFPGATPRRAAGEPNPDFDFTLDDFRRQFAQLKSMGPLKDMLASLPGWGDMIPEGEVPEAGLKHIQGMIDSMTREERRNPDIIDLTRRRRIAAGSGVEPHEVKQFLGHFEQVRVIARQMAKMSMWERS